MKQLTIYLSILTFVTALILGCGKKFDEEKHKAILLTQSTFEAEHQTLVAGHQKNKDDQKAMFAAKKTDATADASFSGLLKQQSEVLTQHENLMKKHSEMAESYKKKEIDGEHADAQEVEMKREDETILTNNKTVETQITDFKSKHEKPAAPIKVVTTKKKK